MHSNQRNFFLKPDVVFQLLDDSANIISLETEEIYKLNFTGTEIVKLIEQKKSIGEIITIPEKTFDVHPSDMETEVIQLLEELRSAGLIEETSNQ